LIIKPINDRGYVLVAGSEGCPDMSSVKSFNIVQKAEKDIAIELLNNETGSTKAGTMTQKGYFQLGKVFEAGKDVLCVDFNKTGICLRVATREEVDSNSKVEIERKNAARKAPTSKASQKSNIEAMLASGTIKAVDGKPGAYEYVKAASINENDKVTCLRKSGVFTVKSIDKKAGVVSAEDTNKQHHYFGLKEVAVAK
jgi:hypothetical protein